MYALESRVTRSINGRAAHFDIPKWRDPLQPQLPYRIAPERNPAALERTPQETA
jgi:hypothetical protein